MTAATIAAVVTYPGPGSRHYEIRDVDGAATTFVTGPDPGGHSADEVAVANLIGYSESHAGVFTLIYVRPPYVEDVGVPGVLLAAALDGVGRLVADQDAVASDAQHLGPLEWVRVGSAARRGLDVPWRREDAS